MSIFQKIYYRALKKYHTLVITGNHFVYGPIAALYNLTFQGSIVQVKEYNLFSSKYLFKYDTFQTLYHMLSNWLYRETHVKKLEQYKQPGFESVHEIVCWDGKRYLTKQPFDIKNRVVNKDRTRLLYAYICMNKSDASKNIDITEFINRYSTSFTESEQFKILDLLPILYAQQILSISDMYTTLACNDILIQAMDAKSLQEITFKDNPIVLN